MTKLPDEIEKDIHNLCNELRIVYNIEWEVPVHMEDRVYKALQKHLTHPTDEGIEKPIINYDAACMYIVANGLSIHKDDLKWILKAAGVEIEGIEKEEPTEKLLAATAPINGDMWCEIYGYIKDGIVNVTRTKYIHTDDEVKPPTKDTIEKIEYLSREEIMVLRKTDKERFDAVWSKLNELVDTVNHQQEQIQQLLSGK